MDDESLTRLEGILLATWPPAETEEREGWVAAANHGFTGRANSVTVLRRTDPDDVETRAAWAEEWYRSRSAPPAVRVTPLSADLEPALEARGYRWWRAGASVMVAMLSDLLEEPVPAGYTVEAAPTADGAWYDLSGHGPDARRVLDRMFDGVAPQSLHLSLCADGEVVAIGRGVLHDGHLAIFGMETAPAHRRRGLARAVIGELSRWAVDGGADRATLQVEHGNDGARSLYAKLGFVDAYDYTYLALDI